MKGRRNALLWALGWWLVRRQVRRRAAAAMADVAIGARARRGRFRSVLGLLALAGLAVAGFVAFRKLTARPAEPPVEPLPENAPA